MFIIAIIIVDRMVDSMEIVEMQLKQLGCEVTIRKKEALEPKAPGVIAMTPQYVFPSQTTPNQINALDVTPSPAPTSPPVPAFPAPAKASGLSHPPLNAPWLEPFTVVLDPENHHLSMQEIILSINFNPSTP